MRILLIAALVSSVAVAGCRGGEKNSNTSASNSASSNSSGSASGGTASSADAWRQGAISQCEETIRANPNAPPGFDAAGTCNCAIQSAFGDQADPVKFAQSPEGRQALTQSIVKCGSERMGAAGMGRGKAVSDAAEEKAQEK
jgi:hypothetical protein